MVGKWEEEEEPGEEISVIKEGEGQGRTKTCRPREECFKRQEKCVASLFSHGLGSQGLARPKPSDLVLNKGAL